MPFTPGLSTANQASKDIPRLSIVNQPNNDILGLSYVNQPDKDIHGLSPLGENAVKGRQGVIYLWSKVTNWCF